MSIPADTLPPKTGATPVEPIPPVSESSSWPGRLSWFAIVYLLGYLAFGLV